jgi:hypothetical protein
LSAGTMVVKSAGNFGATQGTASCGVTYPAQRPHLLTVGGVRQASGGYDALPFYTDGSAGGGTGRTADGRSVTIAAVNVAAPAEGTDLPVSLPEITEAQLFAGPAIGGTSDAAALTSGLSAFTSQNFGVLGWTRGGGAELMVNIMAMADRFDGVAGADFTTGPSVGTGHGRVKTFVPSSAVLSGHWGWGWRSFRASQGVHRWSVWNAGPESSSLTQWKWSMLVLPEDPSVDPLSEMPTYLAMVVDTCPPSGGGFFGFNIVAFDDDNDYQVSFHLEEDDICPPGQPCRCLEMQLWNASTTDVRVVSADYFHSETALH